jgi:hypothetical protein
MLGITPPTRTHFRPTEALFGNSLGSKYWHGARVCILQCGRDQHNRLSQDHIPSRPFLDDCNVLVLDKRSPAKSSSPNVSTWSPGASTVPGDNDDRQWRCRVLVPIELAVKGSSANLCFGTPSSGPGTDFSKSGLVPENFTTGIVTHTNNVPQAIKSVTRMHCHPNPPIETSLHLDTN